MMTRRIAATLALLALLGSGVGRVQALGQVEVSVQVWSAAYHLDPAWVTRILECESSFNPAAYNPSGASGVAQFMPSTFDELRAALDNDPTLAPGLSQFDPEYGRSLWDVDAAIHVMAWALAHGQAWRWECA